MIQFTKFTERYAWNNTVHKVVWEGTVLRVVENGTVYKVNLQVFKSGSFPVADIKGSGDHVALAGRLLEGIRARRQLW